MPDTAEVWTGEFGRRYTDRNTFTRAELDALYVARYGVSRAQLNAEILAGLPLQSVLEVGCNLGQQLRHLDLGSGVRLCGVDVQTEVLRVAQSVVPAATFVRADARSLPFADGAFDLVFTSGVLIHIPPTDLGRAMDEIHRISARWLWGLEYWSPSPVEVTYRGESSLLWKRDFRLAWQERFPTLRLVRERRLPYLEDSSLVDAMYLLEKV